MSEISAIDTSAGAKMIDNNFLKNRKCTIIENTTLSFTVSFHILHKIAS